MLFAAILKVLPDVNLRWNDVWVGGFFIALLFVIGKYLIAVYLAHAGKASVYGAAGSLALILLSTYYSALIFLLGVEFTQGAQSGTRSTGQTRRGPLRATCRKLAGD
jgi:membrane protein